MEEEGRVGGENWQDRRKGQRGTGERKREAVRKGEEGAGGHCSEHNAGSALSYQFSNMPYHKYYYIS